MTSLTQRAIPNDWRSHQPGKAIWILVAICDIFVRATFLSVYYTPKYNRQTPEWTWWQALANDIFRAGFRHSTHTKLLSPLSLEVGAEKERFVVMKPPVPSSASQDIYQGPFRSETVRPTSIGGTWYPKAPTADELATGPVILHFHGGSFIWGTGRQEDCGFTGESLAAKLGPGAHALLVQYRLAGGNAGTRFPAAIQDALTSYVYLLSRKVSPRQIIVSGDSAGGIPALALVRYLAPKKHLLPAPAACLLFSPTLDLRLQGDAYAMDGHRNQKTDFLPGATLAWGISCFVPDSVSRDDPYLAPARHPFSTQTPIWVQGGGAEVFIDTFHTFVSGMQDVKGNRAQFYEVPHAPHDILFVGHILGWRRQAEDAVRAAAQFLSSSGVGVKVV